MCAVLHMNFLFQNVSDMHSEINKTYAPKSQNITHADRLDCSRKLHIIFVD
jgi:hypothetical protein